MIHSIDRNRWCAPIFFHSADAVCVCVCVRMCAFDRLFTSHNNRDGFTKRKNEIQTKTISLWLLLYYYYCCGEYTLFVQFKGNQWSLPQSFCISVSFPRCDHYLRIAQILFIANECWMITAPSTQFALFHSIYTHSKRLSIEKRAWNWMVWNRCHYK